MDSFYTPDSGGKMRCLVCGKDLADCEFPTTLIGLACASCVPRGEPVSFRVRAAANAQDDRYVLGFLEGLFGETEFIEFGKWYHVKDMEKLVAEGEDGERLGFAVYCREEDRSLMTLLTINVNKKFMRRGVASALLGAVKKIASESKVKKIRVPISNDDLLSYVFYHRRGFRLSGLDPELCLRRHGKEEIGFWQLPLRDELYLSLDVGSETRG